MRAAEFVCVALLGAGCATAGRGAPRSDEAILRLRNSPVAQEVARAAPDAFTAFASELARAEAAPGDQRDAALEDARVTLAWAQSRARASVARERTEAAMARVESAEQDTRRAEQQAEQINAELDRTAEERTARERAREAVARPPTTSAARAAASADLRQQTALLLAAARLLGAADDARAPAERALTEATARASAADALLLAGRAYQSAETLVARARQGASPTANAPRTDDAALLRSVAETPELDPHRDARPRPRRGAEDVGERSDP